MRKEFIYAFCISRTRVFNVGYFTLGTNTHPYFATSAAEFNRPKTDYRRGGQAQKDLCTGAAYRFWRKWDALHLKDLTDDQHAELCRDIEELKKVYPHHIVKQLDTTQRPYSPYISFYAVKAESMKVPKR